MFLVLPIVSVLMLLINQGVVVEIVTLPLDGRAAFAALLNRLKLLIYARWILPVAVPVLLTLVLPFVFHPPVLKPYLHLLLRQIQQRGYLHPPGSAQVSVKMKLLLQLQELRVAVRGPQPPGCTHQLSKTSCTL